MKKQTFALYFGNRGFMPAELIEGARQDMAKAGAAAVSNKEYAQFHDILVDATAAMKENVITAMKVFSNM